MSSASSVASSIASFRSSPSSHASHQSQGYRSGSKGGDTIEDDRYSDESFAADDSSHGGTAVTEHEDDSGYDDDEFEEEEDRGRPEQQYKRDDGEAGDDDAYSDDFDKPNESRDDPSQASAVEMLVSGTTETWAGAIRDQATQQPDDDLPRLLEHWTRHRAQLVLNGHYGGQNNATRTLKSRPRTLTNGVIATITERLLRRKDQANQQSECPKQWGDGRLSVAPSLVDRARVQHLLALSAKLPPRLRSHEAPRLEKNSLSTFCAVKTADLSGRLASMRLEDLCAKWYTPDNDGDMPSRGVLEFIADTACQHRTLEVLRESRGDDCVFRAMIAFAMDLERTQQEAKSAVTDSKALVIEAQRILSSPDAHQCQCQCSGATATTVI